MGDHGETPVLHETHDPVWSTRLRALGQIVVPLADVQHDKWYAIRAVALRPMDDTDQKQIAALRPCRLFVSIQWHGVESKVKSRPIGFQGNSHSPARRRDRSPRTPQKVEGAF